MADIKSQVKELETIWEDIYKTASTVTTWRPHLPNTSLEIVNEAVQTVAFWMDRVRAPAGFAPAFQLAQSVAAVNLQPLLASAAQLKAAQYNHFPIFLNQLVQILAAIHTMISFGNKDELEKLTVGVSGDLLQGIAVLKTAQREFADKLEQLRSADALAEKIEATEATTSEVGEKLMNCLRR